MKEELIKELADKLGVATEVLWTALVRQAPISAISSIVGILFLLFIILILLGIGWKLSNNDCEHEDRRAFISLTCFIVAGCLFLVWLMWVCMDTPIIIAGLFNPEYWALKQIIK